MRNFMVGMFLGGALCAGGCGLGSAPGTRAGDAVFTPEVLILHIESAGGGDVPTAPPGSTCQFGFAKYTLSVAARQVDWMICDTALGPFKVTTGALTLSQAQLKELIPALENLTVVQNNNQCGADKPTVKLLVTSTSGPQEYGDSFYACSARLRSLPLVGSDQLDNLLAAFDALLK